MLSAYKYIGFTLFAMTWLLTSYDCMLAHHDNYSIVRNYFSDTDGKECDHLIQLSHSRIPVIWHPEDRSGARLSNIPNYQTIPTLTEVLTSKFVLLIPYLGCKTNHRSILFGYLLQLLVWKHRQFLSIFMETL